MQNKSLYINSIATVLTVAMLFSCKSNFNEVQKIGVSENQPIGIAENINLKYTDSGRVTANLISPKMLDFTNRDFGYNEFPDGIILHMYDDLNQKNTVIADYAISYKETNLIDLQGNVVVTSHKKDTLFAEQLYYDQTKEWLFTNKPVTFRQGRDLINGKGFDSDSEFKQAQVLEIDGIITLEE
ncbi:LPS export ABC transporter periplasmic protein LptC [Lacinutrix sp. WUR7]|uniref:LPS export ABC transporter periplasmic protein LptC n=1 Tax=Lacinutrix sp. WUR7 TaxID=2653681 RepID=UPI00193DDAEE|nr:LPS export ABC transporter periplasmic protein LptC [Lacinutrix sp. WUR7]QRM88222.1 LPS export ABC transporter periplasmic protein LptC [Lacinutrix sp. WUR7]